MKPSIDYLAGFFDGEGCININDGYDTSYYLLHVSVSNTQRKALEPYEQFFGGSIGKPRKNGISPNAKPIHKWSIDSAIAEEFIEEIIPYLILKKPQAELALYFRTLFKEPYVLPRGKLINNLTKQKMKRTQVMALREDCYQKMQKLNKRGI